MRFELARVQIIGPIDCILLGYPAGASAEERAFVHKFADGLYQWSRQCVAGLQRRLAVTLSTYCS